MSERPFTPYNIRLASAAFIALRGRPSSTDLLSEHCKEMESIEQRIPSSSHRASHFGADVPEKAAR